MSSNSTKHINPPISGTEICSPLFSWKDCFSASSESTSSEDGRARSEEGQNQRPPLPTGVQNSVQPKAENIPTILQQVPFRSLSPLAEISGLAPIFDHPFQSVAHKTTLTPDFAPSLTHSPSSDSETSSSMMPMMDGSPSLSPIMPDDTSPPPQKRLKKETPFRPIEARSMFRVPNVSHALPPPIAANYMMRHRDNDLMRELNQLPSMFHPAALPCILPGENGEEQLSSASPRLAPSEVKKEKRLTQRRNIGNPELKKSIMSKRQSRKKTNVACTNCVRAKAGCDQGRPCSRCTRLGKSNCVDRPINTRRRRKPARRFVEEPMERCEDSWTVARTFNDSCEDTFKTSMNEFIIGSYNGDVDGYIDYYMAQAPSPLSQHGYNPMRSSHSPHSDSAILPPPLPPIPCVNAMAPKGKILYYGQTTNWATWNPILGAPPTPLDDTPTNAGSLFASGDIRNQDLSHSPALSAMDMSKPSQTATKFEIVRPPTTSPKSLAMYYY